MAKDRKRKAERTQLDPHAISKAQDVTDQEAQLRGHFEAFLRAPTRYHLELVLVHAESYQSAWIERAKPLP